MLPHMTRKLVKVVPPQVIVDNTSWTANVIDTAGYDHVEIIVHFGAMDIAMVALKVQESEVKASATSLTGGADVTGLVFATSANDTGSTSALPIATSDDGFFSFSIDCRGGRMRYLLLVATGGDGSAGTYMTAWAELWRAKDAPRLATECGLAQRLLV